jgi:uncharacterized membrane protein YbhN (UPF0104 family)
MKKFTFILKLIVSAILTAFVFYKFPVGDILTVLKNVDYAWLAVSFLLGELIILNQAFRWYYLLIVSEEQKPKFGALLKYTVVGYFFNLFVPGGIGGDAYRSIALGKAHNVIAGSVASVFVARILGLVALCLLFWLALPYYSEQLPEQAIWFMVLVSLFLIVLCICLAFNPFKKGKFGQFADKLREYKKEPLRLLAAIFGSLFMQILVVLMQFALFKAIGIFVPMVLVFVVVPVTALLTTIPVSFNGIGVREWSMLSLTAYTINSEQLLASLLLGYAIVILQAIRGGIILLYSRWQWMAKI